MSKFLRDESLRNLDLPAGAIEKLNECFEEIKNSQGAGVLISSYVIRFDNKGFRLDNFQEALRYFRDARYVQRFIFNLLSEASLTSSFGKGKSIILSLDVADQNNCTLTVQDDSSDWVDFSFWKIKECLNRLRNGNSVVRNKWVHFLVQLLGVLVGFFISLWGAIRLSPLLLIENASAFAFIMVFLVFSNIWTVLFDSILRFLNYLWPNISFKEKKPIHWLAQTVIGTIFVALLVLLLSELAVNLRSFLFSVFKIRE